MKQGAGKEGGREKHSGAVGEEKNETQRKRKREKKVTKGTQGKEGRGKIRRGGVDGGREGQS